MSLNVSKRTFGHGLPAKIQISLRMQTLWSESFTGHNLDSQEFKKFYADNEDSDQQTARMRRLIWVFVGRNAQRYICLTFKCVVVRTATNEALLSIVNITDWNYADFLTEQKLVWKVCAKILITYTRCTQDISEDFCKWIKTKSDTVIEQSVYLNVTLLYRKSSFTTIFPFSVSQEPSVSVKYWKLFRSYYSSL